MTTMRTHINNIPSLAAKVDIYCELNRLNTLNFIVFIAFKLFLTIKKKKITLFCFEDKNLNADSH